MVQLRGSGVLRSSGEILATIDYDLTLSDEAGIQIYRGILAEPPEGTSAAQGLGDTTLTLEDGTVVWLVIKSIKNDCAFVAGSALD